MSTRADNSPDQAKTEIREVHEKANRADSNLIEAREREEELVEQMNALVEAGHTDEELSSMQEQHQQAERDLDYARQVYEEALEEVGRAQDFWFEEEVDEETF